MSHQNGQPIALFSDQGDDSNRSIPEATNPGVSTIPSDSTRSSRQPIALISVDSDPAIVGKQVASNQSLSVRKVSEALANLGWQVDIFTHKTQPDDATIVQHSPYCRTIRLNAGSQTLIPRDELFNCLPEFLEAFQKFQTKEGSNYPLIHTHSWLSGWVGLQLKSNINIQLVHTHHSLAIPTSPTLKDRLAIEQQILQKADCIVAITLQEREQLQSLVTTPEQLKVINIGTEIDSLRLSNLYRRLLAQSIMDERFWHLPLPSHSETGETLAKRSQVSSAKCLTLAS
ncbi:MAG TPA: hypothetical protein DD379_16830 [Cyanobacteria bacterium UBA11162]|nr:hypothetical protein [Cyanobacteria bacterium UBA11162]